MSIQNLRLCFFILCYTCAVFQGNSLCEAATKKYFDPFDLFKPREGMALLKNNCAQLCNECDGVATLEKDVCRCKILSDYPMQCLERIQRKAQMLGLKVLPKSPLRTKRCMGGGTTGFPVPMFGIGLSRAANDQITDMGEQMVGQPTEALNTLAGIITAPLMEQIKAIFGGDSEGAKDTIPGQIVSNFPKVLSSFTSLFDTLNVAAPTPKQFVGDAEGSVSDNQNPTGDFATDVIGSLPIVNQLRTVFVGDPYTGNVENTLPVQFARSMPLVMNSFAELLSTFGNIGTMGSPPPKSTDKHIPADKKWLYEDDDDDDSNDSDKSKTKDDTNVSRSTEQKIIVSPFKSNGNPVMLPESVPMLPGNDNSQPVGIPENMNAVDYNPTNVLGNQIMEDAFKSLMSASGLSQVIKPEETVIIINPTARLPKPFMENS